LSHPRQVVFDEEHWGKFVTAYCCTGARQFDVHPPHGKLLLTVGAVLGGYDGSQSFESIGLPYGSTPVFWLRLIPALCGIAIPILFFFFLRRLGGSVPIAWIGGFLLALDNALILETRTMLFDGILVASSLGALVALLSIERATTPLRAWTWTLAGGALAGLAVGTKFTGLSVPALIAIWLAHAWWIAPGARRGLIVRRGFVMGVAGVAIYLGGWMVHFALLTQPGPADAFHPTTGRFIEDLRVAHSTMIAANAGMVATHPDASLPLTWPIMKVPPFFWSGETAVEYLIGNPVVWWGSTVMLVVILVNCGLTRVTLMKLPARPASSRLWWVAIAYALAYLPFFRVTRILFLYHYFTPLVFGLACVLLWLDEMGWTRHERAGRQRASYYGVMVAAVVGFLLMSPLTYGYSAGAYGNWLVNTIRSWR
ncbi:MAG TPA: phospholipid carrier-dependent glycosyltransferase, partial [Vicinamibacterales bacterium]|nr:phospholipid carrier-dependent glycosyltransferase [Vicinamibacterales bacterium]